MRIHLTNPPKAGKHGTHHRIIIQVITAQVKTIIPPAPYSNYNQNYNTGFSGNDYYAGGYEKAESTDPLTVVDYLWMMIISGIPIVGIVYILYTAFAGQNINKKNWAKAMLILAIFGFVLAFVFIFGVISAASII